MHGEAGGGAAGVDIDLCSMDDGFWSGAAITCAALHDKDFAQNPNAQVLVTTVLAGPALIIALLSPFGIAVRRFGRKNSLVAAIVVYAIAGSAPVWLNDIYYIIASRMVVSASEAILTAVATVLTVDYFSGRARAMAGVPVRLHVGDRGDRIWPCWRLGRIGMGMAYAVSRLRLHDRAAILFLWEPTNPTDQFTEAGQGSQ
jgi:hypothetical protein